MHRRLGPCKVGPFLDTADGGNLQLAEQVAVKSVAPDFHVQARFPGGVPANRSESGERAGDSISSGDEFAQRLLGYFPSSQGECLIEFFHTAPQLAANIPERRVFASDIIQI